MRDYDQYLLYNKEIYEIKKSVFFIHSPLNNICKLRGKVLKKITYTFWKNQKNQYKNQKNQRKKNQLKYREKLEMKDS